MIRMWGIRFGPPEPGWEIGRHPESPYQVASAVGSIPAGHGVLRIRTGYHRDRVTGTMTIPGATSPVLLVDGRPVCDGWGEACVAVPAGDRLVEVQSSGSAARRVVPVGAGRIVELDFVTTLNSRGPAEQHLADRGRVRLSLLGVRRTVALCVSLFFLILVGPFVIDPVVSVTPMSDAAMTTWSVLLLGAPIGVALAAWWRRRSVRRRSVAAPAELPDGVLLLDAESERPPRPPDGHGALIIDARFTLAGTQHDDLVARYAPAGQRLPRLRGADFARVSTLGEMTPPAHRPWISAPVVTINGRLVVGAWARLWYPVPPGTVEVGVGVPPPSAAMIGPDTDIRLTDSRAMLTERLTVAVGEVAQLRCRAAITATPAPDSTNLSEYDGLLSRVADSPER